MPFLLYLDGDARQHIVELEGAPLSIGRDVASDIPLEWDTEVSRAHAMLERIGGGVDASSTTASRATARA